MPRTIEYTCCICHRNIENKDTIRLEKQLYGIRWQGGHGKVCKYDFCKKCYSKFDNWINKHMEE